MKVIGKSDQGYLIAASEDEITNLFAFSCQYDKGWQAMLAEQKRDSSAYGRTKNLIGLQIHPKAAYEQLAWLRRRNSEFDDLVRRLRKTADAIEASKPLFTAVIGDEPE